MTDEMKGVARIGVIVATGFAPALLAFVLAPSRGVAIAAVGNAAMAVAFVAWTQRLVGEAHHQRLRESALRGDLSSLEETLDQKSRELRESKSHDAATGALNRATFLRRVVEMTARDGRLGKTSAFLLVDVEGFKAINVERGRNVGDATLQRVANALEDATRGTDCVGRLGGDEFGVMLSECDDPGPAVNRIFLNLQSASGRDDTTAVHVAVGAVTIENPAAGVELPELLRLAEGALASVRGTGGSLCARRTLRVATDRQTVTA